MGNITAASQAARLVVTAQMILDLLVLGRPLTPAYRLAGS